MPELALSERIISTEKSAFIVGIVNANHDSFWKKSRGDFSLAKKLITDGADILDIGAESTRPGAGYISEKDELNALIPLVRKIRKVSDIPVSVDTRKLNVMKACFEEGADILNDISALEDDPRMAGFAAEKKIPVILMHKRENPVIMERCTDYSDVYREVEQYLLSRCRFAEENGILPEKIIIDPGIGFAKTPEQNLTLIKNAGNLCGKKYRIMMALSRKSFLKSLTGREVKDRLAGTLAANLYSVMNGVSFVRVHDVKETSDSLNVLKGILNAGT